MRDHYDYKALTFKLLHEQATTKDELNRLRMRLNRGNAQKEWEARYAKALDIHNKCHF